jgi:hypothetical protein
MIIAQMTEKEKAFSKKYSQKTPPPDYTGIEGGGLSGETGLEYGTGSLAAGAGQPGNGTPE